MPDAGRLKPWVAMVDGFPQSPLVSRFPCHLVSGPPASGKTHYARRLAAQLGACLLDSDTTTERLIRAGMVLAGLDPNDRDSPAYKMTYRDAVYEAMFDLAVENLAHVPVVLAGPFTREGGQEDWPDRLHARLGVRPELHYVWCPPEIRRQRMAARAEPRDLAKISDWESYVITCREERPVWPHHFTDTSS
jgi:predicted kinase